MRALPAGRYLLRVRMHATLSAMRRETWLVGLGIAALAVGVYLPSLKSDLVYDARAQILIDDYIHKPAHLWDVLTLRVMGQDVLDYNRPTHLASMIIDATIWGTRPVGYHLTSILLHAACSALVFALALAILRQTSPDRPAVVSMGAAAAAGVLFAVHPLNCEAIAEPSYREDPLSCVFLLLGLVLATRFPCAAAGRTVLLGGVIALSIFIGVGAKESAAAGPVILAMYWLLLRRSSRVFPWVALCVISAAGVGLFLALRFSLAPVDSVVFPGRPRPLGTPLQILAAQTKAWGMYFKFMVQPTGLSADYTLSVVVAYSFLASAAGVLLVVASHVAMAFARPISLLGSALFWLAILPVSNFIPIYRPFADRFLYLPLAGMAIFLAVVIAWPRWSKTTFVLTLPIIALLAAMLAARTVERQSAWRNSLTLWQTTLAENPQSNTAADNLGWALYDDRRYSEALHAFNQARRLTNDAMADAWAGIALTLESLGRPADAEKAYAAAIQRDNRYADPHRLVKGLVMERKYLPAIESLIGRLGKSHPATADKSGQ